VDIDAGLVNSHMVGFARKNIPQLFHIAYANLRYAVNISDNNIALTPIGNACCCELSDRSNACRSSIASSMSFPRIARASTRYRGLAPLAHCSACTTTLGVLEMFPLGIGIGRGIGSDI
jgi:hypothetical protein